MEMQTIKKKVKVALDFDGVLVDIIPILLDEIEKAYGKKYTKEEVTSWGIFYNEWGIKEGKLWRLFDRAGERIEEYPIIDEFAESVIFLLKHEYDLEIDVVTSDPASEEMIDKKLQTLGFTEKHIDNLVCLGATHNKAELDYDVYIDDNPNLCKKLKEHQIQFLYDQPWNKHIENTKNVFRIYSFTDLLEKIEIINRIEK